MTREVTEKDFRLPEFRDAKPEDYEFRRDGKLVRKDRWERAVHSIASILQMNGREGFEIEDVIAKVKELVHGAELDSLADRLADSLYIVPDDYQTDALRYRTLRENCDPLKGCFEVLTSTPPGHLYGESLDVVLDNISTKVELPPKLFSTLYDPGTEYF